MVLPVDPGAVIRLSNMAANVRTTLDDPSQESTPVPSLPTTYIFNVSIGYIGRLLALRCSDSV